MDQFPCYLSLEEPTGVPYMRHAEDLASRPYVNLRQNCAALDQLPEPARDPILKDYLRDLNAASIFETVGCEVWEQQLVEAFSKGCYV